LKLSFFQSQVYYNFSFGFNYAIFDHSSLIVFQSHEMENIGLSKRDYSHDKYLLINFIIIYIFTYIFHIINLFSYYYDKEREKERDLLLFIKTSFVVNFVPL